MLFTLFFLPTLIFLSCTQPVPQEKLVVKNGLFYLKGQDQPFTGRSIQRFSNGKVRTESRFLKGKRHGKFRSWYSTGRKRFVNRFKNGKRDGACIGWYENGQIKLSTNFKKGKARGMWIKYHWNGKKAEEETYAQDLRQGDRIQWYSSGEKKYQSSFRNGTLHGTMTSWYDNGQKRFEKHFVDGNAHGKWRNWYSNGKPKIAFRIENGKVNSLAMAWYEDGRNKWLCHGRDNSPVGAWLKWYGNGVLKSRGVFEEGSLQGQWAEWHENGRKKEDIFFQAGRRRMIRQWYATGTRRLNARWRDHSQTWTWTHWDTRGMESTDVNRPIFRGLYPAFFSSPRQSSGELTEFERQTLASRKRIDDFPLYVMDYNGGYGLDSFLLEGIPDRGLGFRNLSRYVNEHQCSTFMARNQQGQIIFAYNWDYIQCPILILFTRPPDGYASVSMVGVLGMNRTNENPHLGHLKSDASFLGAPFYPLMGMNEQGLALSCMYVPGEPVWNPSKVNLNMCHIIRVVLDYAADVDEAIQLFRNYNNIHSMSQHFLVTDTSGKSAIIEYLDGGVKTIFNRNPWQACTNSPVFGVGRMNLYRDCQRYKTADSSLRNRKGSLSWKQAMTLLKDISMTGTPETVTSTVMNIATGQVYLALGRNYTEIKRFRLKMRDHGKRKIK